jgi:hypothetical protein
VQVKLTAYWEVNPVTINGIRINKLIISTRVPGSIEIIFFSVGDLSGLGFSSGEFPIVLRPFTGDMLAEAENFLYLLQQDRLV